jgi:hypothetical protein
MKFKIIPNFISKEEQLEIISFSKNKPLFEIKNEHIKKINDHTNGWSILYDFNKTDISKNVAKFQGDASQIESIPPIFHEISNRISKTLSIDKNHVFFQYIFLGPNGKVYPHYDAGTPGYITYKCNIAVDGPSDAIYVDKNILHFNNSDLYCFEANFYKHWMDASKQPRIHLSYGFLIPYESLGYNENSPRVKLSNRIWRAFINGRI